MAKPLNAPKQAQDEFDVAIGNIDLRDVDGTDALVLEQGKDNIEVIDGLNAILGATRVRQWRKVRCLKSARA